MEQEYTKAVAEKVRAISRHVGAQGSAQRMESWLEICGKRMSLDCTTRWSSTFEMLGIAVELKDKIGVWVEGREERASLKLKEEDWTQIKQLLKLLALLAEATSIACQAKQPVSFMLPLYNIMYYDYKNKLNLREWREFEPAMVSALACIDKYYKETKHTLTTATVLDARANFLLTSSTSTLHTTTMSRWQLWRGWCEGTCFHTKKVWGVRRVRGWKWGTSWRMPCWALKSQ